ncbi:MAG: transcription termination/antitermination NusG family protein [Phycisphaerae bacterium]
MRQILAKDIRDSAPPMTLDMDEPLSGIEGIWSVLHTRARNEKALAWELYNLNITYFLPLVRRSRKYLGRRAEVTIPLFPGYIFLACRFEEERYAALRTHRIAKVITVDDQQRLIGELDNIRRTVNTPHMIDLYPRITRGRRCRVVAGCLKGIEGVVVKRNRVSRIFLDVSMLGQSAVVEIDAMLLEPLN